jgi:hypothetical protein
MFADGPAREAPFDESRLRHDLDRWTARPLRPVRRPPLKHDSLGGVRSIAYARLHNLGSPPGIRSPCRAIACLVGPLGASGNSCPLCEPRLSRMGRELCHRYFLSVDGSCSPKRPHRRGHCRWCGVRSRPRPARELRPGRVLRHGSSPDPRAAWLHCGAHYVEFLGYSDERVPWETPRLSWDGFRNVEVGQGTMAGEAWCAVRGRWLPFSVDVATGRVTGGAYG